MINYRKTKIEDLKEIMEVIGDIDSKELKKSKETLIDRISKEQLLCAILKNKVIGFLGWDTRFKDNPKHWYLEQITIRKDYREKGIGRDFVKYFLDFCHQEQVEKIYAHVQEHNSRSQKMFLGTGWNINTDSNKEVQNEITIEFNFDIK